MDIATRAADALPRTDAGALERAHDLFLQRRDAEALPHARAAVQALPQRADAWTLLGIVLQRLGRPAAADQAYREALRVAPDYADAWTNLGNLLRERDDLPGTLHAFQQAMRCAPGCAEPAYNLGVSLEHFGLHEGALAAFEAALECDPAHMDARWNGALALLREGRFAQGFRDYEARFLRREPAPRDCPEPAWDGRALEGRTLLVWAEQGFGDALQFMRFVPALQRCGGRVVLEVHDGLQGLASRLPGVDAVCVRGHTPPRFDTHIALMSLPHVLGMAPAPTDPPYLQASGKLTSRWRARLAASGHRPGHELAVGLVWAGNPAPRNSHERSPGFAAVRELLDVPGTRVFSLQKGAGRDALVGTTLPPNVVDLDRDIAHFDDTAAIISQLDVVVTCDTAVAHLAGALGQPTFVLLPHTRDWRYGLDPHASAWYPSMRLFRQSVRGEWGDVVSRVGSALSQRVASLPSRARASAHAGHLGRP